MDKFKKARRESQKRNEHNDCAVVALSIACRVPYNVAHDALRLRGRKNRRGTYWHQWKPAIGDLGCTSEGTFDPRQPNGSRYTTKTIGKKYSRGYYLVRVNGHLLAMVNGKVLDWTEGRKYHVKEVYKITVPKGSRS